MSAVGALLAAYGLSYGAQWDNRVLLLSALVIALAGVAGVPTYRTVVSPLIALAVVAGSRNILQMTAVAADERWARP